MGHNYGLEEGAVSIWTSKGHATHSRAEFWDTVSGFAGWIENQPKVGRFGVIFSRTSFDVMALFIAMIACGREVSFFPPESPRQDLTYYLEQQRTSLLKIAPTSILVLSEAAVETLSTIDPSLTVLHARPEQNDRSALRRFQDCLSDPSRVLFWQHSSGTTGIKKAVGITSAMLQAQYESYWPAIEGLVGRPPRVASWLPLYHDMGLLSSFLMPLLAGCDLAIMDPVDWTDEPSRFLQMIECERSNVSWMPNFAFRHFSRLAPSLPKRDLSSMALWISCSEPCRYVDTLQFEQTFQDWGVKVGSVLGCYAMAETVFAATQSERDRRALAVPRHVTVGTSILDAGAMEVTNNSDAGDQFVVLSSGPPIPNVEVRVFVDGMPREQGVYGEIGLRSSFQFRGYRDHTGESSNIRDDGFYLTGDLGVILNDHTYIFGRSKEMIIVNGKNVYASDVEDRVGSITGLRGGRIAAFGLENENTGSEGLIIVAERTHDGDDPNIRRKVISIVNASFGVSPQDVRIVAGPWIIKSTSGKISREKNREKYLHNFRPVARMADT